MIHSRRAGIDLGKVVIARLRELPIVVTAMVGQHGLTLDRCRAARDLDSLRGVEGRPQPSGFRSLAIRDRTLGLPRPRAPAPTKPSWVILWQTHAGMLPTPFNTPRNGEGGQLYNQLPKCRFGQECTGAPEVLSTRLTKF